MAMRFIALRWIPHTEQRKPRITRLYQLQGDWWAPRINKYVIAQGLCELATSTLTNVLTFLR